MGLKFEKLMTARLLSTSNNRIFFVFVLLPLLLGTVRIDCLANPYSDPNLLSAKNLLNESSIDDTARVQVLLKQMAPLIINHPSEGNYCCFPGDAEEFWTNRVVLCQHLPLKTFDPSTSSWLPGQHLEWIGNKKLPLRLSTDTDANCYITQGKKAPYPKLLQKVPCDCEYYFEPPYLQAKYWIWWTFNDEPKSSPHKIFDHEGDWEHIELRAKLGEGNAFQYSYFFNLHGRPVMILPTHWESSTNNIYAHPKIWCAKGSHTLYPDISLGEILDEVADSDLCWKTYDSLLLKTNDVDSPVWSFKGAWGAIELTPDLFGKRVTDPPPGPAAHSRFENSGGEQNFP